MHRRKIFAILGYTKNSYLEQKKNVAKRNLSKPKSFP